MIRVAALLGLCAVLTAFLLSMIWGHQQARNNGAEIILDMEPVDPRSLFRGHYVIIRTPLNRIDTDDVPDHPPFKAGDKIFVSLAPANETKPTEENKEKWIVTALSKHLPTDSDVFIQGRVSRNSERNDNGTTYRIQYNIESYFADKVSALALEKKVEESKMRVILAVDENGKAVIRGLEIDGTRFIDEL